MVIKVFILFLKYHIDISNTLNSLSSTLRLHITTLDRILLEFILIILKSSLIAFISSLLLPRLNLISQTSDRNTVFFQPFILSTFLSRNRKSSPHLPPGPIHPTKTHTSFRRPGLSFSLPLHLPPSLALHLPVNPFFLLSIPSPTTQQQKHTLIIYTQSSHLPLSNTFSPLTKPFEDGSHKINIG